MVLCCCRLNNRMLTNNEERDLGVWWLPAPTQLRQWLPIPILTNNKNVAVPYGYKKIEGDNTYYHPIPEQLEFLEEAKKHLKRYTYREVVAWLTKRTGRPITETGLKRRIDAEQNSRRRADKLRRAAKLLESKIKAAEAWESKIFQRYKDAESPVDYLSTE